MRVVRVNTVKSGMRWTAWVTVDHPDVEGVFLGEAKHRDKQRAIDNATTKARVMAGAAARKARRSRG